MTHTASHPTPRTPAALAAQDLTVRGMMTVAGVSVFAVTVLDLVTDGQLGFPFSLGFVLIVFTLALAVDARNLFPAGVMPPALLLVTLFALCVVKPGSVAVDGVAEHAGLITRYIASVVDHGLTLVVGHGLALAAIVWRILRGI